MYLQREGVLVNMRREIYLKREVVMVNMRREMYLKREVVMVNMRREMKRFLWILVLVTCRDLHSAHSQHGPYSTVHTS